MAEEEFQSEAPVEIPSLRKKPPRMNFNDISSQRQGTFSSLLTGRDSSKRVLTNHSQGSFVNAKGLSIDSPLTVTTSRSAVH